MITDHSHGVTLHAFPIEIVPSKMCLRVFRVVQMNGIGGRKGNNNVWECSMPLCYSKKLGMQKTMRRRLCI